MINENVYDWAKSLGGQVVTVSGYPEITLDSTKRLRINLNEIEFFYFDLCVAVARTNVLATIADYGRLWLLEDIEPVQLFSTADIEGRLIDLKFPSLDRKSVVGLSWKRVMATLEESHHYIVTRVRKVNSRSLTPNQEGLTLPLALMEVAKSASKHPILQNAFAFTGMTHVGLSTKIAYPFANEMLCSYSFVSTKFKCLSLRTRKRYSADSMELLGNVIKLEWGDSFQLATWQ